MLDRFANAIDPDSGPASRSEDPSLTRRWADLCEEIDLARRARSKRGDWVIEGLTRGTALDEAATSE